MPEDNWSTSGIIVSICWLLGVIGAAVGIIELVTIVSTSLASGYWFADLLIPWIICSGVSILDLFIVYWFFIRHA